MNLLLQSALRALLLGGAVWALLRLLKLRDARSETAAWTLVLAAALAMPLLTPLVQRWLPGTPLAAAPMPGIGALAPASRLDQFAALAVPLLWWGYGLGAGMMLTRLAIGLVLSRRLYRRTVPLAGMPSLRIGTSVRSPMVFGSCILLPAQWREWPQAKRDAVLAHEQCHVARGDFFLQLAARLYRAFFWFSPFAWWLQRELSALAERDSDAAAVRRMGDPASYAEILVEEAVNAQGLPALVAMAHGPDIAWRVDRILTGDGEAVPGAARRLLAASLVLAAIIAFAGIHAVLPARAAEPAKPAQTALKVLQAEAVPTPAPRPASRDAFRAASRAARPQYDPRALLRDPAAIRVRGLMVLTNG